MYEDRTPLVTLMRQMKEIEEALPLVNISKLKLDKKAGKIAFLT
jgi:hypothetical protein